MMENVSPAARISDRTPTYMASDNDRDLVMLDNNDFDENITFGPFPDTSILMPTDGMRNPIVDTIDRHDAIESPIRINPSETRPAGFASLKTETFDNNFKDLEGLKHKHELLALSKRYLYSKLYTPKLEALQKLVEPGKYNRSGEKAPIGIKDSEQSKRKREHEARELDVEGGFPAARLESSSIVFDERNAKPTHIPTLGKGNVVNVSPNEEYINGYRKKRIQIPKDAYKSVSDGTEEESRRVVLKLVRSEADYKRDIFDLIEDRLDKIVQKSELYGSEIMNPELIINELESIRPPNMDKEIFFLLCLRPIGMELKEFSKLLDEHNCEEFVKQLYNFNLLNINAMGYVLDAEQEILKELNRLGRIHKKLLNEGAIYTKILSKMRENFMSQAEDLLKTTRQDLRLDVGSYYLQWGRIKNIVSWKQGDPVVRETGFAHDIASNTKIKTLQRMQEAFGTQGINYIDSPTIQAPINEAQYIYYIKELQDLEEKEQKALQQQVPRDRMQALSEFSGIGPPFKPANCLAWKCIGLSCNSVIWKMYDTVECNPVVYKFRALTGVDSTIVNKLKNLYEKVLEFISGLNFKLGKRHQVIFSDDVEIDENYIVEDMTFIKHMPFSVQIEKSMQLNQSERYTHARIVVRELAKLVSQLKNLNFILPLKSSRIYVNSGSITLSAGIPVSLFGAEIELFNKISVPTIATQLWGKDISWYLPPEADDNPAYTNDPLLVSKAHTWMIGRILYEALCPSTQNKKGLDLSYIDLCEDTHTKDFLELCLNPNIDERPTVQEILDAPYMKRERTYYGTFVPMDVPKVRCAVELLGDIETIVLNKIRRTEKGVADYEERDDNDLKFCESNDENLGSLTNEKYVYNRNIAKYNP